MTTASRSVHVTSPNNLHFPQVKQILAAGKHVVCEKPLAMDPQESAELVGSLTSTQDRGGQFQHPLLSAQPASPRRRGRRVHSATCD